MLGFLKNQSVMS